MPFQELQAIPRKDKISVAFLAKMLQKRIKIGLTNCAAGFCGDKKFVKEPELHRPGLALAGYTDLFTWHRIQVMGNTECRYINNMGADAQKEAFSYLLPYDIPVIFLTNGNTLSPALIDLAEKHSIPVYSTDVETTQFMFLLRDFLEDQFALQTMVHGALVDVYGIGILISGKSGIGKSEVALDLVERGHRLVSDDVVMLTKKNNVLMASATEMNKHFMEIRGLGIIDAMSMFGIRAIRYQKRLEVVLELTLWDDTKNVERTGLGENNVSILNVEVPHIFLPITPGKNITVIAEVIAMNHLLKHYGYDAAKAFQAKIKKTISEKQKGLKDGIARAIEYFEGDIE